MPYASPRVEHSVLESNYFACQTNDSHELSFAKLTGHCSEDSRTARTSVSLHDNDRVLVKPHVRPVGSSGRFATTNHNTSHDLTFFDRSTRHSFLNTQDDDFAQASKSLTCTAEHLDATNDFRPAIISYIQHSLHLDHRNVSYSITKQVAWQCFRTRRLMSRQNLDQFPTLQPGMWLALDDLNSIIYLSFFPLVMSVTNCSLTHNFPVERVTHLARHFYTKSL
jgi:hypothetical protein